MNTKLKKSLIHLLKEIENLKAKKVTFHKRKRHLSSEIRAAVGESILRPSSESEIELLCITLISKRIELEDKIRDVNVELKAMAKEVLKLI